VIPKNAKFQWDPRLKRWWTPEILKAKALLKFADETCLKIFNSQIDNSKQSNSYEEETDKTIEIPGPPGQEFMGFQKNGIRTVKCPKCKGLRIHEINIACNLCLFAAKKEAIKLLDILVDDFGIKRDEIYVYFSGSMGYHITVSNSIFEKSDQFARSEIVDYVSGKGLIPKSLGVSDNSTYDELMDKLPSETDFGWRGRIARHFKVVKESYEEGSEDAKKTMIELYVQKKYKKFTRDVQKAAKTSGANVDPSVTTDIHRIFRLPGTLNGKTGLLKKKCKDIDTFDPLIDAVVLDRKPIKVEVNRSPKFTLLGEEFGPYKSENIELPAMAAVYLMGLGMAEVQG